MAVPEMTNNSPSPGHISWALFHIQYEGVGYEVAAGSTSDRWVWWRFNAGVPVVETGAEIPANLIDDDLVLFGNKDGIALRIQSSNLIDGELIVDGTIFADAIATNQISTTHIVTAGLDASVIKFGTMSGERITAATISTLQLSAGAVTAEKIFADAVTANAIAAGSVVADKIAADAVVAGKIAADAVTANTIAASAVTATKIAANAVTANTIDASAVTATKIAASAVVAGKIAADAVTASTIAASAVTATKIAANAVTADKIAAGTITAAQIAAGAIDATKLTANAIDGKTITGAVIQTSSDPAARRMVFSDAMYGYTGTAGDEPAQIDITTAHSLILQSPVKAAGAYAAGINLYAPYLATGSSDTSMVSVFAAETKFYYKPDNTDVGQHRMTIRSNEIDITTYLKSDNKIEASGNIVTNRTGTSGGFYDQVWVGGGATGATINTNGRIVRTGSTRQLKDDIADMSLADAQAALNMKPVTFKWKPEMYMGGDRVPGFVAEDAEASGASLFITHDDEGAPTGVRYAELSAALLLLVKDLISRIQVLETRLPRTPQTP